MKRIVIIGLREGARMLHIVDRLHEEFNVIALADDINQVASFLKEYEIYATDLFDFSHKEFEGQISSYLDKNINVFRYDELDSMLEKADAIIVVGAPARAGTLNAFLDNSIFNSIFAYKLNGQEVGVLGVLKEVADYYGKQIILSISDEASCLEAKELGIPTISNKKAIIRNRCERYSFEEVEEKLKMFFSNKIELKKKQRTIKSFDIDIEFIRSDFAYLFMKDHPKFMLSDPRSLHCHIDKITVSNDLLLKRREI